MPARVEPGLTVFAQVHLTRNLLPAKNPSEGIGQPGSFRRQRAVQDHAVPGHFTREIALVGPALGAILSPDCRWR